MNYGDLPPSYDTGKQNPPRVYFAGRCETCGAEYESASRPLVDEDGTPDYEIATHPCASCGAGLCEACEHHRCEYCGALLCPTCAISELEDSAHSCRACHQEIRAGCAVEEAAEREVTQ